MRLLYVEDNPANLFLVQRIARMGNHDVVHYSDGQAALDAFENEKPDLVLMDVQLPGKLNGLDVVKLLRQKGHKTPIVAVTAYAMVGDRERCLEAGCDSYISKPLPVAELVELIKRFDPQSTANLAKLAAPAEPKSVTVPAVPADNTLKATPPTEKVEEVEAIPTDSSLKAAPPVENKSDAPPSANIETTVVPPAPSSPEPEAHTEVSSIKAAQPSAIPVAVQEAVAVPEKQPDQSG